MACYLDNNASTALDARVLEAMQPYLGGIAGNASSLHRFGRLQRDAIETARAQVAALVNAQPGQVIFTSGGTESNNLALQGVMAATGGRALAIGATEHMSVLQPAEALQKRGARLGILPVDTAGGLLKASLADNIKDCALASVMLANNETGVIQDLTPLLEAAVEAGVWIHTDATQAAGKIELDFAASGVHAMTLSSHKIYGPMGAGALILDTRLPIDAMLYGGSQENGLRAGTENVAAIVGFGKAAELAKQELAQRAQHTRELRDALQQRLQQLERVAVFAADASRLPNTLQFGVRGFDGETLLMQLDRKGFAVSSGSACTSGKTEASHVLKAMQVDNELALSAIRVSFGQDNTMQDVDAFVSALTSITEMTTTAVMHAAQV